MTVEGKGNIVSPTSSLPARLIETTTRIGQKGHRPPLTEEQIDQIMDVRYRDMRELQRASEPPFDVDEHGEEIEEPVFTNRSGEENTRLKISPEEREKKRKELIERAKLEQRRLSVCNPRILDRRAHG